MSDSVNTTSYETCFTCGLPVPKGMPCNHSPGVFVTPDKDREHMHRRAQKAESKIERAKWWLEAAERELRNKALRDCVWPSNVPRFYLEEALKALVGDRSA